MMFLLRRCALRAATGRAPVAAAAAGVTAARRTSRSSGGLTAVCAHASAARGSGGGGSARRDDSSDRGDALTIRATAQRQGLFGGRSGGSGGGGGGGGGDSVFGRRGGATRDRREYGDGDDDYYGGGDRDRRGGGGGGDYRGTGDDDYEGRRGSGRGGGGGGRVGSLRGRGGGGRGRGGARGGGGEPRTAAEEVADLIQRQQRQRSGSRPAGRGGRGVGRGRGRGRGGQDDGDYRRERRRYNDDDGDGDDGATSLGKSRRAGARISAALAAELGEAASRRRNKTAAAADDVDDDDDDDDNEDAAAAERAATAATATATANPRAAAAADRKARRAAELAARDPRLTGGVQPSKEARAAEAAGVKRSFARAEALPEGVWERLRAEYLEAPLIVKIGRRGATAQLADAVHAAWRAREVVKLRVHDDRSARNAVLPRFNLMLRDLEEITGGVLVDVRGTSIWLYRGENYEPRPAKGRLVIDKAKLIKPGGAPQGTWRVLGGCRCYETSGEGGSDNSGGGTELPLVVALPDLVALEPHAPATLQAVDHLARVGGFRVVLPDLLAATPDGAWPRKQWPPESVWKPRYDNWARVGPGSWAQQRDRIAAVVDAALGLEGEEGKEAQEQQQQDEEQGEASGGEGKSKQQRGGPRYAMAGIGWGGRLALWAATDGALDRAPTAVACLDPTLRDAEDEPLAKALKAPAALLPPKHGRMDRLQVFLSARRPQYNRCLFKRFGHCSAGLLSYAPEFTDYDPEAKAGEAFTRLRAVHEATEMVAAAAEFLNQHLSGGGGGKKSKGDDAAAGDDDKDEEAKAEE